MSEISKTVLDALDSVTDVATEKIVRPAHKLARFSVYSFVVGTLITIALIFLTIAVFRATTLLVEPWVGYLIWGIIFCGIGSFLWVKK